MILHAFRFTNFKHDGGINFISEANKAFLKNINEFHILKGLHFFKAAMLIFYKFIVEDLVQRYFFFFEVNAERDFEKIE